MNAKINDKQNSDNWMSEEQTSDDRRLTKINSWRTAWRSLLTKFFADEYFLPYSIVFWLLEWGEAQWPIGYGVGLRIKWSSVRIRPWPLLRWVLGQGSLLPLSQGEAFTLASISYLAILVKYILAKKKKKKCVMKKMGNSGKLLIKKKKGICDLNDDVFRTQVELRYGQTTLKHDSHLSE